MSLAKSSVNFRTELTFTLRLTSRLAVLIFITAISTGSQESRFKVSGPEQIKEDFSAVPCEDKKRLEAVKSLFERAGVPSSEVTIDKYKEVENFVWTKKGRSIRRTLLIARNWRPKYNGYSNNS